MTFDVTYTAQELREARPVMLPLPTDRFGSPRAARVVIWSVAVLFAACCAAYVLKVPSQSVPPVAAPTSGVARPDPLLQSLATALVPWVIGLTFVYFLFRRTRAASAERIARSLERVQRFDVDGSGVTVTDGPTRTCRQWPAFDRFVETDRLLMLRIADRRREWMMLPKRVIADPAELVAVRALFAAASAPASPGFPVVSTGPSSE